MSASIIVGIDGSGPSRAAFAWALARATSIGAEILAVHCIEEGSDSRGPEILEETVGAARTAARTVEIRSELVHGAAPWELAAVAHPGDLVVVGTHKTGYLNGRVLGTRSVIVASVAPCSVVVVPDATLAGRTGILVGVAADGASDAAVLAGARDAARTGEDLTLLHCTGSTQTGRGALSDAVALVRTVAPDIEVRSRLSRRRPAEALLDASRSASLLVVGSSRRGMDHLGSVAYEVLLNINTTVMVAR